MEEEEKQQVLNAVFGYCMHSTKDLNGVPVHLRTLYDWEMQDAVHRSLTYLDVEERLFYLPRWKLAHSLVAVNELELPASPEAKFTLLKDWPNFYVEQLILLLDNLQEEERDLGEVLKNSGGIQEEEALTT